MGSFAMDKCVLLGTHYKLSAKVSVQANTILLSSNAQAWRFRAERGGEGGWGGNSKC